MILTDKEKLAIANLKFDESIEFNDESKSNYRYEIEKINDTEYRVSKHAVLCLKLEYFSESEDVINFIEKQYP
ncbi:hypothetical protein [Bacillus cereus]|uniref:hypothetical protein n=1 Tax=Bacillus cereus TaxID=1396 RepID=UPI000C28A39E|nr:hypothetical protein [Bacillus cereus]